MSQLDRYTCEQAFNLLDDFLDREISEEERERVEEHLAICAMCAEEFRFEAEIVQSVRLRVQKIAVPLSLQSKITDALRRARADTDEE